MDANIQTAASLLRRASYNLQTRIRELHSDEQAIRSHVSNKEKSISHDLFETGTRMAVGNTAGSGQYLVRHIYDLRKRRQQMKAVADQKVEYDEREIQHLQRQSSRLDELARTLEMWH